jgi:RNase P subunit RPR2
MKIGVFECAECNNKMLVPLDNFPERFWSDGDHVEARCPECEFATWWCLVETKDALYDPGLPFNWNE